MPLAFIVYTTRAIEIEMFLVASYMVVVMSIHHVNVPTQPFFVCCKTNIQVIVCIKLWWEFRIEAKLKRWYQLISPLISSTSMHQQTSSLLGLYININSAVHAVHLNYHERIILAKLQVQITKLHGVRLRLRFLLAWVLNFW